MTRRAQAWMAVLACAGLAAAAGSTWVHLQMLGDPGQASFCDINARVSCTQVYQSRYGSVLGVPVALGGVIWFAGALLLAYAGARAPRASAPHVAGYALVWSTVGLAVAMYLAYASIFVLGTVCLLCVAVYGAVIGIFVVAGSGAATPVRQLPAALVGDVRTLVRQPVGLGLAAAFVVGSLGAVGWAARAPAALSAGRALSDPAAASAAPAGSAATAPDAAASADDGRTEFERYWANQPRVTLTLPETGGRTPAPDDAVVVLKFNDYQCPACASAHRAYAPVFAKYASSHPGRVRQVTMDFPLDPECNDQTPRGQHHGACEAAVAVRLAAAAGDAQRAAMEEWLYTHQAGMTRDAVTAALDEVAGIDAARFDAAYDATIAEVRADIAVGGEVPIEATPTYVIAGVVIKGTLAPEYFDQAIAFELARRGAPDRRR